MTITLTYSLTRDQFMHAARVLWSYQGIGNRGNWIIAGLGCIGGVALLNYGIWTGWLLLATALILAALNIARIAIWSWSYPRMVKYSAPITAGFSQNAVHTASAQGTSEVPWSTFKSYAETPDYFFLFQSRRNVSIIPKSAAKDDLEIDDLRLLITAKLPRAKMRWT